MYLSAKITAAALLVTAAPWLAAPAAAAPIAPMALQNSVAPLVETVQYRRSWRGSNYGAPLLGLAAGAIIGGAILGSSQSYGYYGYDRGYHGYAYAPGYARAPGYVYAPGYAYARGYSGGDATAYCLRRFRSYNPATGTYLGFDGLRHPCP